MQGSDLIGNGQNMTICKNTMSNHIIKPSNSIKQMEKKRSFRAAYKSYEMFYYADQLAHSCTDMMHKGILSSKETVSALTDAPRLLINFMHNFYEAYENYSRVKQFTMTEWKAEEMDFKRLAYLGGLSAGNFVNLVLKEKEHEEVSRGEDPFKFLSNYEE